MTDLLTPAEAAALLTERGLGQDGRPVLADTVRDWRERGLFPGARHIAGPGRGVWLIPLADLDAFAASYVPGPVRRPRKPR